VLCGGYEECDADYVIQRDAFPFLTLEFVLAGKGRVRLGDREAAMAPGMTFTYGPGTLHEIVADPSDPPRKYFVNFAGRSATALLRDCNLTPGSISVVAGSATLEHLFDSLIEHGARGSRVAGELCDALFKYVLLRISSIATRSRRRVSLPAVSAVRPPVALPHSRSDENERSSRTAPGHEAAD
jgi:hypothetical protein